MKKPYNYDDSIVTFTSTVNSENEEALLGSIMRDGKAYDRVREIVKPEMFGVHAYAWAWSAIERLSEKGLGIDMVTVGDELERMQKMDDFSHGSRAGRPLLTHLRSIGDPRNVESYAENIYDYHVKRLLDDYGTKMVAWSRNGRRAPDIISDIDRMLGDIVLYSGKADSHSMSLKTAISMSYDATDRAASGNVKYVQTGLVDLDKLLGGLMPTNLYLVAARPGQGKTGFLLTIAKNVSQVQGKNVYIFSIEMSNEQLATRLLSMECGVPVDRLTKGQLTEIEWPLYTHAVERLEGLPIDLNDMPSIFISQIRQHARRENAKKKIDLIIVDYIQLAQADEREDRRDLEIGKISRGLKALAKELDVPVLSAAQLSRELEKRAEKRPVLSDLRESGNLEQDADVVMFIYRPDQYEKETAKQNVAEIIVAKHRNGPVGSVDTIFKGPQTKFENAASRIFDFRERKDVD